MRFKVGDKVQLKKTAKVQLHGNETDRSGFYAIWQITYTDFTAKDYAQITRLDFPTYTGKGETWVYLSKTIVLMSDLEPYFNALQRLKERYATKV